MSSARETETSFTAREYQVELLEKSLKKNIVVCLGTGSGKTFIAVMLIKELMNEIEKPFSEGGKRTFFLAKTVPLVMQQAAVIRDHTGLSIGHYTGSMNVDAWDKDVWKKELEKNHVLVMTTQILVNILNMSFISLSQINLLIFDECHHAVGGDPIVQVMRNFERFRRDQHPRVLGLTASVLNGKCKPNQILSKIKKLEIVLQSAIEAPSNTAMASLFSTKPKEHFICSRIVTRYDSLRNGLALAIKAEQNKLPESDKDKQKYSVYNDSDDDDDDEGYDDEDDDDVDFDDDDFKEIMGPVLKLSRILKDLLFTINELGLWCTNILVKQVLKEMNKIQEDITEDTEGYFEGVKVFLEKLAEQFDQFFSRMCNTEAEAMLNFSSHKLNRLIETMRLYKPASPPEPNLEQEAQQKVVMEVCDPNDTATLEEATAYFPKVTKFKAIIFVERRTTAWVINRFLHCLKKVDSNYEFLSSEFVIGHGADPAKLKYSQMKSRKQQEKIMKFRTGECNVLVATRVVEEGMDIPTCNVVIRFDEPKDFRSYVQSKGRARSKENSNYIMLTDEDHYEDLSGNIAMYRNIEEALQVICQERMPPTEAEVQNFYNTPIPPYYTRGIEGPAVTMFSAIQLVNRYCSLLPKDKFTKLTPRVKFQKVNPLAQHMYDFDDPENPELWDDFDVIAQGVGEGEEVEYRCILWLPPNCSVKNAIKGDVMQTVKLAKKSVAMKVCIALHKAGELNDELLPTVRNHTEFVKQLVDIEEESVPKGNPQPGTIKRRQLYEKLVAPEFRNPGSHLPSFLSLIVMASGKTTDPSIQNIYKPEMSNHIFGVLTYHPIPQFHKFPVHTLKGKIWVDVRPIDGEFEFEEDDFRDEF